MNTTNCQRAMPRAFRAITAALAPLIALLCLQAPAAPHSDPATEVEKVVGKELARAIADDQGVDADPLLLPWMRGIGAKVSAQSPRRDVKYTFAILGGDVANAFALPGGYIFVTRGMLDTVASDDELATIMAHECGHVAEKHAQKQIAENVAFLALLSVLSGGKYDTLRTVLTVVNVLGTLSWSRSMEAQADHDGIGFAFRAGYDPRGLVHFFDGLDLHSPSALVRYFDTHPTAAARIAAANDNPLVTKPTADLREESAAGYRARGLNHAADLVLQGRDPLVLPTPPPLPPLPAYAESDRADIVKRADDIRSQMKPGDRTADVGAILQQVMLFNNQAGDLRWLVVAAEAYALQESVDNLFSRTLRVAIVAGPTFDAISTTASGRPDGDPAQLEAAIARSEVRSALEHDDGAPIPLRHAATAIATVLADLNNRFLQPRNDGQWARYAADAGLLAYAQTELNRADKASAIGWRMLSLARVRRYQAQLNVLVPQDDPVRRQLWYDLAQRRFGTSFANNGPTGDVTVRGALAIELGVSVESLETGRKTTTWTDWILTKHGTPENVATAMRLLTLDLERETAADDRRATTVSKD